MVRGEELLWLILPERNRPLLDIPFEFELESVSGWLWVGHPDGSSNLIDPFANQKGDRLVVGRTEPWPHDVVPRRWSALADGPWLIQVSHAGVRLFTLLPIFGSGEKVLQDLVPGGWTSPPGERLLGRPIFVSSSDESDPTARRLYWLTDSKISDSIRLWCWSLSLAKPIAKPTSWPLKAEGFSSERGAAIIEIPSTEESPALLVAGGGALLAFQAPLGGETSLSVRTVTTPIPLDLGNNFGDTLRLFALSSILRSGGSTSVAIGVENGIATRQFLRVVVTPNEIQCSPVAGTGHPVGVAHLESGSVWVYLNESMLGWVNTLEQVHGTRELRKSERFDSIRVTGRVIALSGQGGNGRRILRVVDLTSRLVYHDDDSPLAASRFTLPAIIGSALLTVDQHDHGSRCLARYWLYDHNRAGNGP